MQGAEELPVSANVQVHRAVRRVGQIVRERWHLEALLGVGGTAAVYVATHRNGKRVALKMLHPEFSASSEMRQRFVDEGYVANSVGHPGAVSVIDDDVTEDGHAFLIMDLLEGENLEQCVGEGGWLLPSRVLTIADELLDILAAAHDKGIVHRDVKPDNIFITRDGKVRLLDFGIARMTTPGRTHTTQSGAALGTPAFMPPEQARGRSEQLDGRTDLWAVGATMFLLLTGRHVHEADTVNEELLAAMTLPSPSLGQLAPHLPQPLIDLVDRALAFEQGARWSNACEMQLAVRKVARLLLSESMAPPRKVNSVLPPAPTLVTPSLEPTAPTSVRSRPFRPLVLVAVSAAASFVALATVRPFGKTLRSFTAPAPKMAMQEARADRGATAEDWLALAPGQAAPETAATAMSSSAAPHEPAPSPMKPISDKLRPKAAVRPIEGARLGVASGARSPSEPSFPERSREFPERSREPTAADPLNRRK
ncbi:MAG TPA: serine/threonine-protein kinase [Polyangiaceae bacterium]|nr:serine/threonine-protein kinase [Polyangiaceae bacterium]